MVGSKSDVGLVRTLNEDYVSYEENEKYRLYIVADGMGGHNAGEIASEMAVKSVMEYIDKINNIYSVDSLQEAIKFANKKIYDFSQSKSELKGMGTTITSCFLINDDIYIANVGDSSCFKINSNEISKVTKDHSWVQELIDIGAITEEEGRVHPKKNIITRALGTSEDVKVDIFALKYNKDDKFLLCSDGLTNEVLKEEILKIVNENCDFNIACEELIKLAKARGGKDNITVLLFGGEV